MLEELFSKLRIKSSDRQLYEDKLKTIDAALDIYAESEKVKLERQAIEIVRQNAKEIGESEHDYHSDLERKRK